MTVHVERDRGFADSPLEEAVSSEPVSERPNSLLAGSLQGISSIRGPTARQHQKKKGIKSGRYEPIPYASEQGIFCGLAGNLNRRSGKFPLRSGNPALVRYLGPTGPTNPILPRDLERLPGSKEGRRQMLAPPRAPLCEKSLAEHATPDSPFPGCAGAVCPPRHHCRR